MIKRELVTCREDHDQEVEFDFDKRRYRFLCEPDIWHDVDEIIKAGRVSVTQTIPWCCSRQAYMRFMQNRKEMHRKG